MSEAKLNWSSAEVKDAKLSVDLDGDTPSRWKESFKLTARMLEGGGDWGKVQLKKQAVRVGDVRPGSEERLRHHLESLVKQANAAIGRAEPDSEPDDHESEPADKENAPDARMAERFRAFDGERLAEPET